MSKLPSFEKKRVEASGKTKFFRFLFFAVFLFAFLFSMSRFMGWLAFEEPTKTELWQKLSRGNEWEKRGALTEWLRQLRGGQNQREWEPNSEQSRYLQFQLEFLIGEDPSKWGYLPPLLGVLSHASDLQEAELKELYWKLFEGLENSPDSARLSIELFLAMARLGLPSDVEELERWQGKVMADEDLRATFAYALGVRFEETLERDQSELHAKLRERLLSLAEDSSENVRWNAVLAMSRAREEAAKPLLRRILLEAKDTSSDDPDFTVARLQLYQEAFAAAYRYDDLTLRAIVTEISQSHPHLRLRQAAKIFVEK